MPYLVKRLSHEHPAFELRMHSQERSSIEFLEGANQDDLNIFDVKHVEVAQIISGWKPINKYLPIESFVERRTLLFESTIFLCFLLRGGFFLSLRGEVITMRC